MYNITIIEDNDGIRNELSKLLERYGYSVSLITDFSKVIEDIDLENTSLILLDINLPYFDGYHICREIRKKSEVPIIIVTSRDSDMDEIMSMNLGADDFITKPYNTNILIARIESIIRRTYKGKDKGSDKITYDDMTLDLSKGILVRGDKEIELTKNEIKIISFLMQNRGEIVTREDLMEHLWSTDYFVDDNTLSVNVTRIRKKIAELGLQNIIETRRGLGYIMK